MMVADFYSPYVGGVEQHVRSLAHGLVEAGHSVCVVTTRTPRNVSIPARDGAVEVFRIRTLSSALRALHPDSVRPWAPSFPDPLAAWAILRLIKAWKPDVVHGHDWLGNSAIPWCAGRTAPQMITTQHYFTRVCAKKDLWWNDSMCPGPALSRCLRCSAQHFGPVRGPAIVAGLRIGARIDRRVSRATIAVSDATARHNCTPPGYDVIPNMFPAPSTPVVVRGSADPLRGSVTDPLAGLDLPDEPYMLYIGGLRLLKGFPILMDAYAQLTDPPPLVVVGERDHTTAETFPVGVHHIGTVVNEAVPALFDRALFGIVPSVWAEPFGIVAIEAMQAKRAVIVSDTGGLGELVQHEETGLLVPPGDVRALAAAMTRLLANPEECVEFGLRAADGVDRYANELVVDDVAAVYARVGSGR